MESVILDKSKGWKNILKIIIPYIFIVGAFQLIGYYIAGMDFKHTANIETTPFQTFVITFSTLTGTVFVVWIFRKYVDNKTFVSLGFGREFAGIDILTGFILGFILLLSGFVILILVRQIEFVKFQFNPADLILSVGIFIFVAITEELLVRGYILNNLLTSFNRYTALVISSLIFSLMHGANPNINFFSLFELFICGLFLGLSYVFTRSLWFPIALHFSWNFFQGPVFGFNVSGIELNSMIVTKYDIANLWNGGEFGFEGSVLSLIFQLIAIGYIIIRFNRRERKMPIDQGME